MGVLVFILFLNTMFLVPSFTSQNYTNIMSQSYHALDTSTRVSFDSFLQYLQPDIIKKFAWQDARTLANDSTHPNLVSAKLLLPTLRTCDYFFWNVGAGTHHGVDIILPQHTPIVSRTNGVVTRVKKRDGFSKNEWNCVVIKSDSGYWSYEHCQDMYVTVWQKINKWDTIASCGSTWNSTQFHLHIQCDTLDSPFQPYYSHSQSLQEIQRYTRNPLTNRTSTNTWSTSNSIFADMPTQSEYKNAITFLYNAGIVAWYKWRISPTQKLQRYEFALIIHRAIQKLSLTSNLLPLNTKTIDYTDIGAYPAEVKKALQFLYTYDIMKGFDGKFSPDKDVLWEEVLAVLWRLFFGLQNSTTWDRRRTYYTSFKQKKIISDKRSRIWVAMNRQETCNLLYKSIQSIQKV